MTIRPTRTEPVAPARGVEAARPSSVSPAVSARPTEDVVEVSATARAAADAAQALSPERAQELLARLTSGFYGRADVLEQLAGRLPQFPE
jgi:hypothetical protein